MSAPAGGSPSLEPAAASSAPKARQRGTSLIHGAVHTTSLLQMGWPHPRCLLGVPLGICCPQNSALGTIWKSISWPGQTRARACSLKIKHCG